MIQRILNNNPVMQVFLLCILQMGKNGMREQSDFGEVTQLISSRTRI